MTIPLALWPVPRQRFFDDNGLPLAGGWLYFFTAGLSTPQDVFADSEGITSLGTQIELDMDGYAPAIYLSPIGYKVQLLDANLVQIWEQDNVEDVGAANFANLGQTMASGSKDVTAGYEVTDGDNLVTVNEPTTDPAPIILQDAAERGFPLTIKNVGPTSVAVTPLVSQTVDNVTAAYVMRAAASPEFPTITLVSDRISNYWIQSSHALVAA